MKKIITFFILISIVTSIMLITSCSSSNVKDKKAISIEQLTTDYPVMLFKNNDKIIRFFFRIPFEIKCGTSKEYYIFNTRYYYSDKYGKPYLSTLTSGWLDRLFVYNSKTNNRIKYDYPKFNKNNPIYIYIETQHDIDTTTQVQSELKPYLDKMIELGQDTMSIFSFNELKKEHPHLVRNLLQGDSISVFIKEDLSRRDNQIGDTIIYVPIKY